MSVLLREREGANERIQIPSPFVDPVEEARVSYTLFHRKSDTHDSPEASRYSLVRRMYPHAARLPANSLILDLGSGRQAVEETYINYLRSRYGKRALPRSGIVTVDIADLEKDQLVGESPHVQASGHSLPFPDGTFPLEISNLALDFMPDEAKDELFRVAKPGAFVFLNLHHPNLIPPDLDLDLHILQRKMSKRIRYRGVPSLNQMRLHDLLLHKRFLRDNSMLFEDATAIQKSFEKHGFEVARVGLAQDMSEMWWEVDMRKPNPDKQRGELIAQFIANQRNKTDHSDTQKDRTLSELSKYCRGRDLTRFMARLRENPANSTSLVESLLKNMVNSEKVVKN